MIPFPYHQTFLLGADADASLAYAHKRKLSNASAALNLATKRRRVLEDIIWHLPPPTSGNGNADYDLNQGNFVTHLRPHVDVVPLEILYPVFDNFLGCAHRFSTDIPCRDAE
jgi:hypothetical protein